MRRVSCIRNEKIVPLFPTRPVKDSVGSPLSGVIVETQFAGPIEVPEHEHSSFCLHLQTSGPVETEWWSEGKHGRESHGPGSMIRITPGTRDRVRWNRPSQRVVLSIDESYLHRVAQELGKKEHPAFENQWAFENRRLHFLVSELRREMESGWATGPLYGDHLGIVLSTVLIRDDGRDTNSPARLKGGISRARLQRVVDYIAANAHEEITLDDLARVANMSRFHFVRQFHSSMGVTPYRYVMDQRLQAAKAQLRLDNRSVSDIALETGFKTPSHVTRFFRRNRRHPLGVVASDLIWQDCQTK